MKIAPINGNQNSWEIGAQVDYAANLFKQELDDLTHAKGSAFSFSIPKNPRKNP